MRSVNSALSSHPRPGPAVSDINLSLRSSLHRMIEALFGVMNQIVKFSLDEPGKQNTVTDLYYTMPTCAKYRVHISSGLLFPTRDFPPDQKSLFSSPKLRKLTIPRSYVEEVNRSYKVVNHGRK